jgi:hypothetical protein
VDTWNKLQPEYRRRVRTSIRVAVQNLLTGEEPTPTVAVTPGAISFNAAGIVGILAEPPPMLAMPPRSFGPLTAGVPIDTPDEVDPVAPVAAGTDTGAAAGTNTSVRCLFLFCRGCSHADHCVSQAAHSPGPAEHSPGPAEHSPGPAEHSPGPADTSVVDDCSDLSDVPADEE